MMAIDALVVFKVVLLTGLAAWTLMSVFNNLMAFGAGVGALGRLMGMQLFEQEPPIRTPLLSRRVASAAWHRGVLIAVLLAETMIGLLLAYGALRLGLAPADTAGQAAALGWANLALAAFLALCFIFLLGGQWFVYYIRQEGLQLTHLVLIGVTAAALVAVNVPGV